MGPKDPSFRYWIEYLGFRLMGLIFAAMPVEWASGVAGALMAKLGPMSKKRHPRLLRNLAAAFPEMSQDERDKAGPCRCGAISAASSANSFISTRSSATASRSPIRNCWKRSRKAARARCCAARIRPIGKARSAVVNKFGLSPMAVYRPMSNPYVDADMLRRRNKYYSAGLMAKHDIETPVALIRHARAGGVVGVLVDQQAFMGLPTPFFGRPAQTTPFPALLARQCNIPLLLIHGYRMPGVRFKMFVTPIDVPRTDDRNADIYAATAAMQAELEKSIRLNPDQWMWTHDRWR